MGRVEVIFYFSSSDRFGVISDRNIQSQRQLRLKTLAMTRSILGIETFHNLEFHQATESDGEDLVFECPDCALVNLTNSSEIKKMISGEHSKFFP